MLTDKIINWKSFIQDQGLTKADIPGLEQSFVDNGLTPKQKNWLNSALSANHAWIAANVLPSPAYQYLDRCLDELWPGGNANVLRLTAAARREYAVYCINSTFATYF